MSREQQLYRQALAECGLAEVERDGRKELCATGAGSRPPRPMTKERVARSVARLHQPLSKYDYIPVVRPARPWVTPPQGLDIGAADLETRLGYERVAERSRAGGGPGGRSLRRPSSAHTLRTLDAVPEELSVARPARPASAQARRPSSAGRPRARSVSPRGLVQDPGATRLVEENAALHQTVRALQQQLREKELLLQHAAPLRPERARRPASAGPPVLAPGVAGPDRAPVARASGERPPERAPPPRSMAQAQPRSTPLERPEAQRLERLAAVAQVPSIPALQPMLQAYLARPPESTQAQRRPLAPLGAQSERRVSAPQWQSERRECAAPTQSERRVSAAPTQSERRVSAPQWQSERRENAPNWQSERREKVEAAHPERAKRRPASAGARTVQFERVPFAPVDNQLRASLESNYTAPPPSLASP